MAGPPAAPSPPGDGGTPLGPLGLPRPPLWPRGQLGRLLGLFAVAVAATVLSFALVSRIGHALLPGGSPAPQIKLAGADGQRYDVLAAAQGHPVVLEFFETTCEICQREVKPMCDVRRKHPGAVFFGLDAARENAAAVSGFGRRQAGGCIDWPLLLDPNSNVLRSYSVTVVPTVYLLTPSGRVAYSGTGEAGVAGLDAAISSLERLG